MSKVEVGRIMRKARTAMVLAPLIALATACASDKSADSGLVNCSPDIYSGPKDAATYEYLSLGQIVKLGDISFKSLQPGKIETIGDKKKIIPAHDGTHDITIPKEDRNIFVSPSVWRHPSLPQIGTMLYVYVKCNNYGKR